MSHHYSIIVGSMLGASEYVAEALEAEITAKGDTCELHFDPKLSDINKTSTWIVCTSTHGAGELPDNIQPFANDLKNTDLSETKSYVIGLGDTSYDTFCHGALSIASILKAQGATLLSEPHLIDVLTHPIPEENAVEWFNETIVA